MEPKLPKKSKNIIKMMKTRVMEVIKPIVRK